MRRKLSLRGDHLNKIRSTLREHSTFADDEENCRMPAENNSWRGKTERDLSFSCTFCQSYFVFCSFKPATLLKYFFIFICTFRKKKLTVVVIPGLPHILAFIIIKISVCWFSNRIGKSIDNGKACEKDKTRLPVPD